MAVRFVFVADDAFPLKDNILKPYPDLMKEDSQNEFLIIV